jgi:hypothetical protein
MLQNLKDVSGSAVPVRVGGTTANHAIWAPNQKEAIIQNFATPGADQPANVTWGPAYLESFKVFPKDTKYTVGVTFDSGAKGENNSVTESAAFYKGIGKDLFAIEVGNEFDGKFTTSTTPELIDTLPNAISQPSLSTATPPPGTSTNTSPNGSPVQPPSPLACSPRTIKNFSRQVPS